MRREERRAQALAAAVAEIGEALDRAESSATAGSLLDRAVVRFGAADPLREQWRRLERCAPMSKAEAASASVRRRIRRSSGALRGYPGDRRPALPP